MTESVRDLLVREELTPRFRALAPHIRDVHSSIELDCARANRDAEEDAEYHGTIGRRRDVPGPGAGLVSVPTSDTRSCPPAVPFRVSAARGAIEEAIGAFVPDPHAGRFARLRMVIGAAARWLEAIKVETASVVMVTLTYARPDEWQPRHVSEFLKRVRGWLARRGHQLRYVWVAEVQTKRLERFGDAVPHYHVAIWVPAGLKLPLADVVGWWPHGMSNTELARHAVAYLMGYLKKSDPITRAGLPGGARCHGRGGLGDVGRDILRWLRLPAFVRARAAVGDRWVRADGGGWLSPSGRHYASEFARVIVGGVASLVRVVDHGRPFEAAGPYSFVDCRARDLAIGDV